MSGPGEPRAPGVVITAVMVAIAMVVLIGSGRWWAIGMAVTLAVAFCLAVWRAWAGTR